ncbi:MAG: hypothetical protein WBC18_14735 [Ottowia sp.]|uniref:hypothetical protein n=1 Tax=Ottowia sp. TaxID=1898956 RepID=UPI003C72199C
MTTEKPTISERLVSARSSSDLTVRLERGGDADLLIASAKGSNAVGRHIYQLMSDWDGCAKRRTFTPEDVEQIAMRLPRIKTEKRNRRGVVRVIESLDMAGAQAKLNEALDIERQSILRRLKSLPHIMDEHSGLMPWVVAQGIQEPRQKLLAVLGWWVDRNCLVCGGTMEVAGRQGVVKQCTKCHGTGEREVPHDRDGMRIKEEIVRRYDVARARAKEFAKQLRMAKRCVAEMS